MIRAVTKHNEAMYEKYGDQVRVALSDANMLAKRLVNNFKRLNLSIMKKADETTGSLPARIEALKSAIKIDKEERIGEEDSTSSSTIVKQLHDFPGNVNKWIDLAEENQNLTKTT